MKRKEAVYLNYCINDIQCELTFAEQDIEKNLNVGGKDGVSQEQLDKNIRAGVHKILTAKTKLKALQMALEALMEPVVTEEGLLR